MLLSLLKFRAGTWRARLPGITDWNVDQGPLLLTMIKIEMDTWIFSHMYYFLLNIITHLCPNVNGGLIKLPLKFSYWLHPIVSCVQYIPRNMHTVFALMCFVVVIHWLIFSYPSGLLHWHCGNLTIAPVPAKQPWWIWINTSCEFVMNDCITITKQSTTKPCAYFLGYTVYNNLSLPQSLR